MSELHEKYIEMITECPNDVQLHIFCKNNRSLFKFSCKRAFMREFLFECQFDLTEMRIHRAANKAIQMFVEDLFENSKLYTLYLSEKEVGDMKEELRYNLKELLLGEIT